MCLKGHREDYKSVYVYKMYASGNCSLSLAGKGRTRVFSSFFCYLFEKSVRLIQYKDMKVINLCLLLLFPLRILVSLGICVCMRMREYNC